MDGVSSIATRFGWQEPTRQNPTEQVMYQIVGNFLSKL